VVQIFIAEKYTVPKL